MKRHFFAPSPRFGRVNNRLPLGHQQRSPYYWWWAYLRRNADYLRCCEKNGKGKLAKLYADFGDVREDNFHQWWTSADRGVNLFAEQPLSLRLSELDSADQWCSTWNKDSVMVVAVPLNVSKRSLKGAFAKLLEHRHSGHKSGRPAMSALNEVSTARYRLKRNYTVHNLRFALQAYDLWLSNQSLAAEQRQPLWQLAVELGINKQAAKDAMSEHTADRLVGRNILAATFSRYVRQARLNIQGAATGEFPTA